MAVAAGSTTEAALENQRLGGCNSVSLFCVRSCKCATATMSIRLAGRCRR